MDDPWAAPAWSTPAKPSSSSPPASKGLSLGPPRAQASFDVSDPWGAPPPADLGQSAHTFQEDASPVRAAAPETQGWGHEPSWDSGEVPAPRPPEPHSPTPAGGGITRLDDAHDMPSWGGQEETIPSSPPPRLSYEAASHTPPRPFPSLPDFTSPRSPLSHHSPHSHRSMTPTITHSMADEEDPEAAFAAALPRTSSVNDLPKFEMPKSPSFGEGDFGGFSSGLGDPWGGGERVRWGNEEREEEEVAESGGEDTSGEGWGYVRPAQVEKAPEPSGVEQDWEAAQRKIQLQESLVPHDKLERIKMGWKEVAGGVIGLRKLPEPTADEVRDLEAALRKLEMDRYVLPHIIADIRGETLRFLASIPSNINTYPPVLSSFTTHTTYLSSLSRPNPSPTTSFLNTSSKRPRRADAPSDADKTTAWLSRSRLGEPEVTAGDAAPVEQESKTRWGFWGRRPQPERQLTTSGGGVLEKKGEASAGPSGELRKSTSQQFGSVPMTGRSSISQQQSPSSSRPGSIFEASTPVDLTSPHTPSVLTSPLSSNTQPPPQHPAAPAAAGPSVVSRFFGRLRRNPSSGPLPESSSDDPNMAKDLELGEDDFSFLGQVPSLAPAAPELLNHHRPDHEMASLESMIASRPTPLPAPLAPPPVGFGGGAKAGGAKKNDMDLLSGLYDDRGENEDSSGGYGMANGGDRGSKGDPIGWDDFLGPTPAAPPKPSPKSIPQSTTNAPSLLPPAPLPPSRPPIHQAPSIDFDDFGTPQKATPSFPQSANFDDFGDFSAFETTPSPPPPPPPRLPVPSAPSGPSAPFQRIPFSLVPPQPAPSTNTYTSPLPLVGQRLAPTPSIQTHRPRPSLDHTPTLNLVNDASVSKGKRWPAPPSPDVPGLSPPPQGTGGAAGGGFPFLSPPPPPRPGSRAGTQMRDMLGGDMESFTGGGSDAEHREQPQGLQAQLMSPVSVGRSAMMPTPPRNATPVAKEAVPLPLVGAGGGGGGKGLSAQDLSFFDNL